MKATETGNLIKLKMNVIIDSPIKLLPRRMSQATFTSWETLVWELYKTMRHTLSWSSKLSFFIVVTVDHVAIAITVNV